MRYCVKLFASLKDTAGSDTWEITTPHPQTAQSIKDSFFDAFPQISGLRKVTRVAANQAFCMDHQAIEPTDELAFIPPVSGG